MLDDRDVAPWAEFNQETRESIRGTNDYQPGTIGTDQYWPTEPPSDPNLEAMIYEDAADYS